jgi:hypothetical protein
MAQHETRSMASVADFKRIMSSILGLKTDSTPSKCFEFSNICDVASIVSLSLSERDIDCLEDLSIGHWNLIRVFKAFVDTKVDDGIPMHDDWQNKRPPKPILTGFHSRITKSTSRSKSTQMAPPKGLPASLFIP